MKISLATIVLTFFCLILIFKNTDAAPRCPYHDRQNTEKCTYGTVLDWCRNEVCAKGPGEVCGGRYLELGKCGDGTFCSCGTCSGCSTITEECFRSQLVC